MLKRLSKTSALTAQRARELLDYDPLSGVLTWKITRPGCQAGAVAGTINGEGYAQVEIDYVLYKAHRVIWLMMKGQWPKHNLDHRNRVRNDNRWENLREATPLQNSRNRSPGRRNKSGCVGVCYDKRRGLWEANIGIANRTVKLGCFEVKNDAIAARCEAEKHYFGDFAAQIAEAGGSALERRADG